MAKKRHHSSMSKRHHSRHHSRLDYDEAYAGFDPRRRLEMEDSHMIGEDHHAPANLPQHVVQREWPKEGYSRYGLDDTIKGIDVQIHDDMKKHKSGPYPEKY